MKRETPSLLTLILVGSLFFSGCSATSAAEPQITNSPGVNKTHTVEPQPTETTVITSSPTATMAPTPEPEPIPCNIAFDSDRDGNRDVYRMGPDGGGLVNLTNNPADDFDPAWSPDGSQIAFVSNRADEGDGGQFIYVMDADGANVRQLTGEDGGQWPDWSHDRRRITYTHLGEIYKIDADGNSPPIRLTDNEVEDQQSYWSPDGKSILWLTGSDGRWDIAVMNEDGGNPRTLTDNGGVLYAAWTVDGEIFAHWDGNAAGCFNCVMAADGSNLRDAGGKGELQQYLPFWTADGQRVELVQTDQFSSNNEIYLVGEIFPDIFFNLTNHPADDRNPDWPALCGPTAQSSTVAAQQPDPPQEITIGYAGDSPKHAQRKANFQTACDELGIRCLTGSIPELIEQGVTAIIQNADISSGDEIVPPIRSAAEAGIPVFVLDKELDSEGVYSVSLDHQKWINASLEWMIESIGGQGEIAYFDFLPGNPHTPFIQDTLSRYPQIRVVTTDTKAYPMGDNSGQVRALFKHFPNVKAIWANDHLSIIVFGMVDAGFTTQAWPLLMCDPTTAGLYIWDDLRAQYPGMQCMAVSNPPGIAYDAVYAAYYLATGGQLDPSALGGPYGRSLYVDPLFVSQDNLRERMDTLGDNADYILDELMSPDQIWERWFID